jgi:hypothetical protein
MAAAASQAGVKGREIFLRPFPPPTIDLTDRRHGYLRGVLLPYISANPFDLPPPDTKRWVARRKAAVVNAVRNGEMNIEDACRYYMLSTEEFAAWERAIEAHGIAGLRVTRLQVYRDAPPRRLAKPR